MKRKKLVVFLFIFITLLSQVFATTGTSSDTLLNKIFGSREAEIKAAAMAVLCANFSAPKLLLPGVIFVNTPSSIFIPAGISFSESDVSGYLNVISPPNKGLLSSFFSKTMNALSPLSKSTGKLLEALNLKKGDMILNGQIEIEGAETFDIMEVIFTDDFSDIDIFIEGELTIKGNRFPQFLTFSGKMEVKGGDEREIALDTSDLKLNDKQLGIGNLTYKINNF